MRAIPFVLALALALAACGGDSGPETAADAAERQYEMIAKQQYGKVYEELHPATQTDYSLDEWIESNTKDVFTMSDISAIDSYDEPVALPDGSRTLTAVTIEFETTIGAIPSSGDKQTITVHEELIDGKWRLYLPY